MFSCEYCETFKIVYFEENLPNVASKRRIDLQSDQMTWSPSEKATGQKLRFEGSKMKEKAFNTLRS